MCLIVLKGKKSKIAKKDIIVYKILDFNNRSPIREFKYKLNKLYETNLKKIVSKFDLIPIDILINNFADNKSYLAFRKASSNNNGIDKATIYTEGFHSCKTVKRAMNFLIYSYDIYKCTIPKGAKYIEDYSDLIISNKIIINSKITTEDKEQELWKI